MTTVLTPLPNNQTFFGLADDFLIQASLFFDQFYNMCGNTKPFSCEIFSENTGELLDSDWERDFKLIFSNKQFHDKIFIHPDTSHLCSSSLSEFCQTSCSFSFINTNSFKAILIHLNSHLSKDYPHLTSLKN